MMELIDPHNAQEIFFDGVHEVKILEGVVRAVLFSRQNAVGVIVARLATPVSELPDVIQALMSAAPQRPAPRPKRSRKKRRSE
jgi:hypothetical protein